MAKAQGLAGFEEARVGNERMNEGSPDGGQGAGLGGARQSLIGAPGRLVCPLLPDLTHSLTSSLPEFRKVPW